MSERVDDQGDSEDRIGALPDELLQHMMSFLLSRDAVRTCVLARRWRTLWKSVPALRIGDPESYGGATGSSTFVDELLRLRGPTPLKVCTIHSNCEEAVDDDPDWDDMTFKHMEPWLQYALSCQVQELTVHFPLRVTNMTIISSQLKRLDLYRMLFEGGSLDFSSCRALELLRIDTCDISVDILSRSLKYLHIDGSNFDWDTRTSIFAPNLVGFRLGVFGGFTPFILSMPSLISASVTLGECSDFCGCNNFSCEGSGGDRNGSIVLNALSGAKNLKLQISGHSLVVFRRDLKCRPMFTKLKKLLLDDCCVVDDFYGLIYFLQHSPILETLTIDLQQQLVIETDESRNNPREPLLLSKHLKVVSILCHTREDVVVPHILKILGDHGVPSKQIVIKIKDEEN